MSHHPFAVMQCQLVLNRASQLPRRFFRVGSMVLLCHDISDIMMEAAKLCKYSGLEAASTALFVSFMVTWLLARLTYFPFWIIRSTLCASSLTPQCLKDQGLSPMRRVAIQGFIVLVVYLQMTLHTA